MSLLDALNIAASGLRTTQTSIGVVSQNVANAQTANYAERQAVVTQLPDQSGVQVASIQRAGDAVLQQQSLAQASLASGDAAVSSLYQQLEDVTGGSSSTTPALSTALTNFTSAWQSFEASPDETTAQQQVVADGTALTQTLGSLADGVDQLAQTAQSSVGNDVTTLNSQLAQIAQLNQQIVSAQVTNTPVPDLQDQRDADVAAISKMASINTVTRPDGSMAVFTTNGLSLVDKTAVSLSWDGTNITLSGNATSVNSSFQNGTLGGTLGFLATDANSVASSSPGVGTLQKVRNQLDAFAASLYNSTATPLPSFEAAYDGATTQTGELASSFFTTSDGSATANRFTLAVNPALVNGTSSLKQAAATPIVNALTATNQSLNAGALSVSNVSYSGVANAIVSTVSANAATMSTNATNSAAISSTLSSRLSSDTGVNLDDEMSNLIVLQNSYSASARVMSTLSSMLTTLMSIGQG